MKTMKRTKKHSLAEQLFEMHLKHEMAAFSEEKFVQDMGDEIDALFELLKTNSLKDFVSAEQIKDVVQRYAVDLQIHGGITELVGEMAGRLLFDESRKDVPCKTLMSARQIEAFIDKALELTQLRETVVEKAIESPVYTALVAEILYKGITQYIYDDNMISKNVPGVASVMKFGKKMMSKSVPSLENAVADNLKKYISNNVQYFIRLSESFLCSDDAGQQVKESLLQIWDQLEDVSVHKARDLIGPMDIQDLIVLGYEFWLKFRDTDYFRESYSIVVDYLFEKYGDEPLAELVDDMGVTPAMAKAELACFAPAILQRLHQQGYIEARLRKRFAEFYQSAAVKEVLAGASA